MRHQREQRRTEQRAGREADHVRQQILTKAAGQQQEQPGDAGAQQAAERRKQDDPAQNPAAGSVTK
jgi:hypothetical protein